MTIEELLERAYQVAALPTLRRQPINPDAAIYKYWKAHPEVGPIAMQEIDVDEGGRAVITLTGKVVWWKGGDVVEVLP